MKTLLSTKTKAVPFHKSVHFSPRLERKGSPDFFADSFELSSGNLWAFRLELRILCENAFLEPIIETGRILFTISQVIVLERFERGHRLSAASDNHSLPLFRFTNQRCCLVF